MSDFEFESNAIIEPWYTIPRDEDEGRLVHSLVATLDVVIQDNTTRLNKITENLNRYEGSSTSILYNCRMLSAADTEIDEDDHSFNVVRVCVNTLANKICKSKVAPRIMTTGASFDVREKTKKAGNFMKGLFNKLKLHKTIKKQVFDACLHGTGIIKVCNLGDKITIERCFLDEIFVESHDAARDNPDRIYEVRYISKSSLAMDFPDKITQIETSTSTPFSAFSRYSKSMALQEDQVNDNIVVIEAWCKNDATPDGKGRHIIATGDCILLDEEWDKDYLPFVKLDYNEPMVGFFANGIGHELAKMQNDITDLDNFIDESVHAVTAPKIFYNGTCDFQPTEYTDVPGQFIRIDNISQNMSPASVLHTVTPSALSGEVYNYREGKVRNAHDQCGISMMAASGVKPAGLDSAVALREYNDIQTERYASFAQNYESVFVEVTEKLLQELFLSESDVIVKHRKGSVLRPIKFSDLALDPEDIEVTVHPASALPDEPAGRMQTIIEYAQNGIIPPEKVPELARMPDIEGILEVELATKKYVDKFISRVFRNPNSDGIVVDRYMELPYLASQLVKHYNIVQVELEDLRDDEGNLQEDDPAVEKALQLSRVLRGLLRETNTLMENQNARAAPEAANVPVPTPAGGVPPGAVPPPMNTGTPGGAAQMPPMAPPPELS